MPLGASQEAVERVVGLLGCSCASEPFSRLYGLLRAKSDKAEERSVPFLILTLEAETEERTGRARQPVMCLGEFERDLPIGTGRAKRGQNHEVRTYTSQAMCASCEAETAADLE